MLANPRDPLASDPTLSTELPQTSPSAATTHSTIPPEEPVRANPDVDFSRRPLDNMQPPKKLLKFDPGNDKPAPNLRCPKCGQDFSRPQSLSNHLKACKGLKLARARQQSSYDSFENPNPQSAAWAILASVDLPGKLLLFSYEVHSNFSFFFDKKFLAFMLTLKIFLKTYHFPF